MATREKSVAIIVEIISLLHVVLFVYAALNKLLDFHTFQVQLGQSPLLSAFAGPVSYSVPAIEILISAMLLWPKFRYAGLYASFSLMVMFTAYIVIMLNFSPFTPCSCGGILEDMGWNGHLVFNGVFVLLGLIALLLFKDTTFRRVRLAAMVATVIISIGVVAGLFLLSEDTIHYNNNFIRRFPKHPTTAKKTITLPYASYYIAGYDSNSIYLGNRNAPLLVTVYGFDLKKKRELRIGLPKFDFTYHAPRVCVRPPWFYFTDGSVPCIFRGDTTNWQASLKMHGVGYFTVFRPIDSTTAVIRAVSSRTRHNALGIFSFGSRPSLELNHKLLSKQVDGIFDTDGSLLYNPQTGRVIYIYYYRNQFIITDPRLTVHKMGKTIDSVARAQLKVATLHSGKVSTLAAQPLTVNKQAATYGNYLFVSSALMGRYEPKIMWDKASVIDVYDLRDNAYAFSFYIYDKMGRKADEFIVANDHVISRNGKFLTIEKIETSYYKPYRRPK